MRVKGAFSAETLVFEGLAQAQAQAKPTNPSFQGDEPASTRATDANAPASD